MTTCKLFTITILLLLSSCINLSKQDRGQEDRKGGVVAQLLLEGDLKGRYQRALSEKNDSLRNKLLLNISYDALHAEDMNLFLKANRQAEKLSIMLADTSGLAGVYWDLGKYFYRLPKKDSAYFYYDRAQKLYYSLGDQVSAGRLLLNLAIIQKDIKDYTGSEVTTTNAIALLAPYKDYFSLYVAYNNMGIVFNELREYDRALFYQGKALNALKKTNNKDRLPSLYNNMGVVYDNKKGYQTAIQYFNRALDVEDRLSTTNPKIYAMILDNRAYAELHLGQTDRVYQEFNRALTIRESLQPQTGISVSRLHLAEYFLFKQDTINAIRQALKAEQVAGENQNSRDLLEALEFLATRVDYRPLYYARRYMQLNDSLFYRERAVRNKFARIRFETDEYITETENLHRRMIRFSILAIGVFLIFILLYIIKTQRSRTKFLEQKQKANHAIYNLKLTRQKHFERGKEEEKHRISRELHDGILAELFGVRLSLESLNSRDDQEGKRRRLGHLQELQEIARKIRRISHALGKDSVAAVDFNTLLEELVDRQPETVDLHLWVSKNVDWNRIDDTVKINVYRILQEALNNIFKHAEATTAKIAINCIKKILILRIRDNGKGFSPIQKKSGMGLKNIKTRAQSIRGKLRIRSGTQGTQLRIAIDLRRELRAKVK